MKNLIYILLSFELVSCANDNNNHHKQSILPSGVFECITKPGNSLLRNWGKEYWMINNLKNKKTIEFCSSRGFYNINANFSLIKEVPNLLICEDLIQKGFIHISKGDTLLKVYTLDSVILSKKLANYLNQSTSLSFTPINKK